MNAAGFARRIITGKEVILSVQAALVLYAIAKIGNYFTTLGLAYTGKSPACRLQISRLHHMQGIGFGTHLAFSGAANPDCLSVVRAPHNFFVWVCSHHVGLHSSQGV